MGSTEAVLPESLFTWSKTFFDKSKLAPGDVKTRLRAQRVDIAYLPLRQDLFGISVWAITCKDFTPPKTAAEDRNLTL